VHIRLVAPYEYRLNRIAEDMHAPAEVAARRLRELDRNREAFFKRYWPREPLRPDHFTATFNVAQVPTEIAVGMIMRLVERSARPA
jgi:hypothetical protein